MKTKYTRYEFKVGDLVKDRYMLDVYVVAKIEKKWKMSTQVFLVPIDDNNMNYVTEDGFVVFDTTDIIPFKED